LETILEVYCEVVVSATVHIPEMRNSVRFPLRLPVALRTEEQKVQAQTQNISAGGVLFEVEQDLPVGSTIEFTIAMPAEILGLGKDVLVNCVGRVVRCFPEGDGRAVAAVIDDYKFER
jgi:hypothetical protein